VRCECTLTLLSLAPLSGRTGAGTLKFRTLFERSLYDMMFRNQAAVKCVFSVYMFLVRVL
jgi:hypothetical protein